MDEIINIKVENEEESKLLVKTKKKKEKLYEPTIEEVKKLVKEKEQLKDEDYIYLEDFIKFNGQTGLKDSSVLQGAGTSDKSVSVSKKTVPLFQVPASTSTEEKKSYPRLKKIFKLSLWILSFALFDLVLSLFCQWNFKIELQKALILGSSLSVGLFIIILLIRWFFTRKPKKMKENQEKKQIELDNLELVDIKRCPQCDSKLKKGKVLELGNMLKQNIKCKNADCDFQKVVEFTK